MQVPWEICPCFTSCSTWGWIPLSVIALATRRCPSSSRLWKTRLGKNNNPSERWVPVAAVRVRANHSSDCVSISNGSALAPVYVECTAHGCTRHFLHQVSEQRHPLLQVASLRPAVVAEVLEYAGATLLGSAEDQVSMLPRLSDAVWSCAWCRHPLERMEYDFDRFPN